jgi:hypothetical protein
MPKTFNATMTTPADKNPGQSVLAEASLAAATSSDAGTFHIVLFLFRLGSPNTILDTFTIQNQAITTTAAVWSHSFTIPSNEPLGSHAVRVGVQDGSWAYQTVTSTGGNFNVVVAPPAVATLTKISGDDQGGTVGQAQASPMVVQALDGSGNPVAGATVNWTTTAGTLSASSATTDAQGNASVTLTHPAMAQTATVTASVGSATATFSQTSHMVLYGKYSAMPVLLKARTAGVDALAGGGFLPDTGDEWVLIDSASDEFAGSAIDLTKWRTRLPGGWDHYNDELQRYIDSAISVSNGSCKLTSHARPYDPAAPGHTSSPSGFQYPLFDSGCLSSKALLKYGYFEARFKLPKGLGVWPAFWLLPNTNWQGEIDIMEFVYNNGTEKQNMIHNSNVCDWPGNTVYWAERQYNGQYGYWIAPSTLSPTYMVDDWRTLSCYWNELDDTTTIYLDGQPVSQRRLGPAGQYSCIIFNLAIGGAWPTTNANGQAWTQPIDLTDQVFEISHVRTFQKSGKILVSSV